MNELRKIPRWKRRIAPADVDKLIDRVNVLSKVTGTGGISVSAGMTGVNIHNRLGAAGRGSFIMEVQSRYAVFDSLYTCRKEKLLSAEWFDTGGADKFDEKSADEYYVLNLMENDPEPGYVAHLIAGSLMECWQIADDGGTSRWVGIPVERLNTTRRAWVKTTPGAVATVTCYLDVNTTGTEITVYCDICGGTSLNAAVPRLSAGDEIYVSNVGGTWYSDFLFQASEDCECTPSLDDLADVTITAAADHDFVMYDSGTSEWIDQTPAQVLAALTGTAGAAFSWNSQNLTSVGAIGIGTAAPGALLEIQSSSPVLRIRDTGATANATTAFVEFGGTDAAAWSRTGYVGDASSGNTAICLRAEIGDLHLGDSSDAVAMILQGGNVGIGLTTVDANYKLIIRRAANINLGIGLQSSELAIAAFNDALSANIPMRLYASEFNLINGNVGIGVTDPSSKLEVNGTVGCGAITSTGLLGVAVAGNTAVLQNTTDAASNQVAQFKAGNRATSANDDSGYMSLFCDNDAGTQMEMVRLKWIIGQDDAGSEEGALDIQLESSGGGDLQSVLYLSHANSLALFDATVKAQELWTKDGTTGNYLKIVAGANQYSADRQLTIDLNNADHTLTIDGNVFLDQNLGAAHSPTFVGLTLTANGDIGLSGTGHITSGSEGFIVGTLTITDGSIDDTDGTIAFGDTAFTGVGDVTIGADGGGVKSLRINSDAAGDYGLLSTITGTYVKLDAVGATLVLEGDTQVSLNSTAGSIQCVAGTYVKFETGAGQSVIFDAGGNFLFRDQDAADAVRVTIASATGNTTIEGTLTVNGDQTGATDHVFDDCNDIELLEKWRAGEKLPFNTGDMLNRDRLLRDTIIQLHKRIEALETRRMI